jgi:ferritin-like metal-binding protein YciE
LTLNRPSLGIGGRFSDAKELAMGLFSKLELNTLNDLFVVQLQDLYDAEIRLTEALPKMAAAATSMDLKRAFENHLAETQTHVTRLEEIFRALDMDLERETCDAMKGLIAEGDEVLSATGDHMVKDAALIAAAQRVEHYEIAGYGTVRAFAQQLGYHQAAALLQETLDEEGTADKILTEIAESVVNVHAEQV